MIRQTWRYDGAAPMLIDEGAGLRTKQTGVESRLMKLQAAQLNASYAQNAQRHRQLFRHGSGEQRLNNPLI
jgi:hypothetical protein